MSIWFFIFITELTKLIKKQIEKEEEEKEEEEEEYSFCLIFRYFTHLQTDLRCFEVLLKPFSNMKQQKATKAYF